MCCDEYDLGTPDGECPDCGEPTVDGEAAVSCAYSPELCPTHADTASAMKVVKQS